MFPPAFVIRDWLYSLAFHDEKGYELSLDAFRTTIAAFRTLYPHDALVVYVPFDARKNGLCPYMTISAVSEREIVSGRPYWLREDVPVAIYRRLM